MAILEVKNLKKSFGAQEVLKGINFEMDKGEVVVIIGSSGSGKTTLLRCLNFLETADDGQIIVDGETLFDGASDKTKNTTTFGKTAALRTCVPAVQFVPAYERFEERENICGTTGKRQDKTAN